MPVPVPVLDASALLAHLRDEPGGDLVAEAIAGGAVISTVNLAEVLSSSTDHGVDPVQLSTELSDRGLLDGALATEPFTAADAVEAARLRPLTRSAGLSLGDRACLALARRLDGVAVTADNAWARVELDVVRTLVREDPDAASSPSHPA
ncbi:MAG: type II toxin-antitoxin system VapC family toxin [Solirubrobacterales bacterium]